MNAIDFIKARLAEWTLRFPGIHLKYAYDDMIEFHIVEVSPEQIRNEDENYLKAENELWNDMTEKYPSEDIQITKPSEINDMSNILYDNQAQEENIRLQPTLYLNVSYDSTDTYPPLFYIDSQEFLAA